MWLSLGALSIIGFVGWIKIVAPLNQLLRVHEDLSEANHPIETAVKEPLTATHDLQNLALSVSTNQGHVLGLADPEKGSAVEEKASASSEPEYKHLR